MTSYTGDPWHQKLEKLKLSAKRKKQTWELREKRSSEARALRLRKRFFSAINSVRLCGEVRRAFLEVRPSNPIEMEAQPSLLAQDKISTASMLLKF